MKTKKSFRMLIVCFMMLLAFSTCAYAKKPSKSKVRKKYKAYIAKEIKGKDPKVKEFGGKATYRDINGDGIEELFYCKYGYVYPMIEVCTYKKGKVKLAGSFPASGGIQYNSKKNRIFVSSKAAVGTVYWVYKLSGTKLKLKAQYRNGSLCMGEKYGHKNNKRISGEQFNKEIAKYLKWKSLPIW